MEAPAVLMVHPMSSYLEEELSIRFNLFKLWDYPSPRDFQKFVTGQNIPIRAVICCAGAGANAELIDSLPNLEIVASYSVGVDKIDLAKCRERGIRVTNTPDVLTDDVADLAIGLALAVLRRICKDDQYVRDGKWKSIGDPPLATKFSGKSVGILGLGRIGLAIAKRAESFGCTINYTTRTQKPQIPNNYNHFKSIIDLSSNSDILFISCSLTSETHHIITRQVLDALGPNGILVNIGRGAHVDEVELVSALVEGRLGGAGLDVFENEPNVPEELLEMVENVVVLSHVGSDSVETCMDMAELVVKNLEAHFQNLPLLTPVD